VWKSSAFCNMLKIFKIRCIHKDLATLGRNRIGKLWQGFSLTLAPLGERFRAADVINQEFRLTSFVSIGCKAVNRLKSDCICAIVWQVSCGKENYSKLRQWR
jgi:hypothetical protein